MKINWKSLVKSYAIIVLGSVIYALGFDLFYAPNDVALGGITGLAQVINHVFPVLPVGILTIVMNVPLFLLGWKYSGFQLLAGSLVSMLVGSTFAWFTDSVSTGINTINVASELVIYDLSGRRVTEMVKGIYIVNGVKVIKK